MVHILEFELNNSAGYENLSEGGDSGAAWYAASTAWGIHHAHGRAESRKKHFHRVSTIFGWRAESRSGLENV